MVFQDSLPVWIVTGVALSAGWAWEQYDNHLTDYGEAVTQVSVLESKQARDESDLKEIRKSLQRIEAKLR